MPNWSQPFIIDTDASDVGIGAVLSQVDEESIENVITYGSRVLSKAECNYCVHAKSFLLSSHFYNISDNTFSVNHLPSVQVMVLLPGYKSLET